MKNWLKKVKDLELIKELRIDRWVTCLKKNTSLTKRQTQTKPHCTLEVKVTEIMDTFAMNTPLNLEELKKVLALTSLQFQFSVLTLTKHTKKFQSTQQAIGKILQFLKE